MSKPSFQTSLEILQAYLPNEAREYVTSLLRQRNISMRVSRPRRTKLGDHHPPSQHCSYHRISVNEDLNPYAFLLTLLHEIAHVDVWENCGGNRGCPKPHGVEWKDTFGRLLAPLVTAQMFPEDVTVALEQYMHNPTAMSCSDRKLVLALAKYDTQNSTRVRVEDIPLGGVFRTANGRTFCRGLKARTRFLCVEQNTGVEFHVHALADVELVTSGRSGSVMTHTRSSS